MNTIPNADLIRAVLDGKVLQWSLLNAEWKDYFEPQQAIERLIYPSDNVRVRLRPEPDVTWAYCYYDSGKKHVLWGEPTTDRDLAAAGAISAGRGAKVLRLVLDPDTLAVIDARTEEP